MDNEADYGKRFFQLSYKEAIAQRIISDYKILTIAVSDERVARAIEENQILNLDPRHLDEAEARMVATGVSLKRVLKVQGATHAISFHSSILAAQRFRDQQDVLNRLPPRTTNLHISSKKSAGERADLLREFVGESRALMTNARCLTEGVDVPAIDCVVFADPKQSRIDIVQAAGRALRRYPGKDYGYILLPLLVPREMGFEEFAETTGFRRVAGIVAGLATQDERIVDEFRAIQQGRIPKGKIVEPPSGDVPVGMHMSLRRFADAVSTRIWQSVARLNWRDFADARAFARGLKLKSSMEWQAYAQSGKKPSDIPANPQTVYADAGWVNWGDWLDTGRHIGKWRPFEEARAFVRGLKLKGQKEWTAYCKSGKKPYDIPADVPSVYADTGWAGYDDWLGIEHEWRPFKDARAFVRGLKLKSLEEWKAYAKSEKRPRDIPASPNWVYADAGWAGSRDWLGTTERQWRSFKDARAFVRRIGLKNIKRWQTYCQSGKKPNDIPSNPQNTYSDSGWVNWRDWLGTRRHVGDWRSFKEARAFVHGLKLKSAKEWAVYRKSAERPSDIPTTPDTVYADTGWVGWSDWLGIEREWRPFKDARAFVRALKLKNVKAWRAYAQSKKKPRDIPAIPDSSYAGAGWAGYDDWLGTGRQPPGAAWRPFKDARAFVHRLKLKNSMHWKVYARSRKRPRDIPTNPHTIYADAGWENWGTWLGTGSRGHGDEWRPFKNARAFVHRLKLESEKDWRVYAKSKKKPNDIPATPVSVYADAGWVSWGDWLGTEGDSRPHSSSSKVTRSGRLMPRQIL